MESGGLLTLQDVQASLERELAFHREREAFHGGQESLHRERRTFHAAEAQRAERELAVFHAALERLSGRAAAALPGSPGVAAPAGPPLAPPPPAPAAKAKKMPLAKAVWEVLRAMPAGHEFSAPEVTTEVDARFRAELGDGPVDAGRVAAVLRRFQAEEDLAVVREGRPHHPGVYRLRSSPS